jgi:hypothetical protein
MPGKLARLVVGQSPDSCLILWSSELWLKTSRNSDDFVCWVRFVYDCIVTIGVISWNWERSSDADRRPQ